MASDKNKQTPKSSVALPAPSMDLEIHFFFVLLKKITFLVNRDRSEMDFLKNCNEAEIDADRIDLRHCLI